MSAGLQTPIFKKRTQILLQLMFVIHVEQSETEAKPKRMTQALINPNEMRLELIQK